MKRLDKFKRNEVFVAIQAAGHTPAAFYWEDNAEDACLRHRSGAYFVFGGDPGRYIARYAVAEQPVWEVRKFSWEALMQSVALWLADVKLDTETPDLWAELERESELMRGAWGEGVENTPFSPDERADVAKQLQELRAYVRDTYSLSDRQLSDLDSKIDYLVDAAERLGRKDWLVVFIGTMAGFVLGVVLPPDVARHIVLEFLNGLSQWLGHGFRALGGG